VKMRRGAPRRQPRIPGVRRRPRHTGLTPTVDDVLNRLARQSRRSRSYVLAEILSDWCGVDVCTGERLQRRRRA